MPTFPQHGVINPLGLVIYFPGNPNSQETSGRRRGGGSDGRAASLDSKETSAGRIGSGGGGKGR